MYSGFSCDSERPNAAWPGARDSKIWSQVLALKSQDSFKIGIDNITKDVCGQNYRVSLHGQLHVRNFLMIFFWKNVPQEADLRVRIEDKKMIGSNAVINEFDCPINRTPDDSQMSANWSPVTTCIPRFPKGGQT